MLLNLITKATTREVDLPCQTPMFRIRNKESFLLKYV